MGGQVTFRQRIARIAARQHGAISRAQLAALGMTARQVEGLVTRGELAPLFRGTYRAGPVQTRHTLESAAVLACGETAVLSHASAAYLYGFLPYPAQPGDIDVTVRAVHRRVPLGIRCHRTASSHPHEVRERHGIPVTSPIRTLVDLAASCSDDELQQAVAEAFALRLASLPSLRRALAAYRGRRGVARLATVLDAGGPRRTRSSPERVLLRAIRAANLPLPETNARLGRWEVDFLWRDARLVVEVDAYSTHSSPRAFERDRLKDAELATIGLEVQRFTADRVGGELDAVIDWITARLKTPRGPESNATAAVTARGPSHGLYPPG